MHSIYLCASKIEAKKVKFNHHNQFPNTPRIVSDEVRVVHNNFRINLVLMIMDSMQTSISTNFHCYVMSFVFVGSLIKTQSTSSCSPIPCQNDLAKEKKIHIMTNWVMYCPVTWLKCKGEVLLTSFFLMCVCVCGRGGVRLLSLCV